MSSEDFIENFCSENYENIDYDSIHINQRICPLLEYSKDKLTVKYIGKGHLYTDISVKKKK